MEAIEMTGSDRPDDTGPPNPTYMEVEGAVDVLTGGVEMIMAAMMAHPRQGGISGWMAVKCVFFGLDRLSVR